MHGLGARIFGLEAENVRGDVVNLLVRSSVNARSEPLWFGDCLSLQAVEMRTSSGKRRTLVSRS